MKGAEGGGTDEAAFHAADPWGRAGSGPSSSVSRSALRLPARDEIERMRYVVVLGLGFFALVAQTLLFREFFAVFEGNELGLGCFFSSWLLWVGVGAWLGRSQGRVAGALVRSFEGWTLAYLPAFLLQHALIRHARALAGVPAFELFPLVRMGPVALLANAPVSLVTGLLFTLACRWVSGPGLPPARVYFFEALGGCLGGVAVTAALAGGWPGETVFLLAGVVLAGALLVYRAARGRPAAALWPLLVLAGALGFRLDRVWQGRNDRMAWQRILPAETYRGRFVTPQARYLYGVYLPALPTAGRSREQTGLPDHATLETPAGEGPLVVQAWESVAEILPDDEHAAVIAALALAQAPETRNVLVMGGGYSLCERFLRLPQIESVTWLHPDPDYPANLLGVLPAVFLANLGRLQIPRLDIRRYLLHGCPLLINSGHGSRRPKTVREPLRRYDLAVINLPDALTLTLNRYFTVEFYGLLRDRLTPDGVLAVRLSGGENYLGGELINLGASVLATLEAVFPHRVLRPGAESWFFASAADRLTDSPEQARDRFAGIPGAAEICPPDILLSQFPADRIDFQMSQYRNAIARSSGRWLLNTDHHPRALLSALLLVSLQGGAGQGLSRFILRLATLGFFALVWPVLLYGVLRAVYLWQRPFAHARGRPQGAAPSASEGLSFDAHVLVFTAGLAGMSFSMLLLFVYQSVFGSLYLHIGLASSLFMLGLFAGGVATERFLSLRDREPAWLLPAILALHLALMVAVGRWADQLPQPAFPALFLFGGCCGGLYVPVAVFRLKRAGLSDQAAGAALEGLDTVGGATGGLLTGLVVLPVFGLVPALVLMGAIVLVNLAPSLLRGQAQRWGDAFDRWARRLGYIAVGLIALSFYCARALEPSRLPKASEALQEAARQLAPERAYQVEQTRLEDGRMVTYLVLPDFPSGSKSYLFTTDQTAPDISGYGGPITLAVLVDRDGTLLNARVLRSHETAPYLRMVEPWLNGLAGRNLFDPRPWVGVDGVSGATVTSLAILETLRASGGFFAQEVLNRAPTQGRVAHRRFPVEQEGLWFLAGLVVALVLRVRPSPWWRRLFLLAVVLVLGWRMNLQYSLAHVLGAFGGAWPAVGITVPFLLAVGVPVVVVVFGNVYCGYMCPFGALQELVGDLRPRSWAVDPEKSAWRFARWLKYALWFALVLGWIFTRDARLAAWDPLSTLFSTLRSPAVLRAGVAVVLLSFLYRRFWCRNLCPAGAFLALLNGLKLLARWWPPIAPGRCDYGVRHAQDLDCLLCDRCRAATTRAPEAGPAFLRAAVFIVVLATFACYFGPALWRAASRETPTPPRVGVASIPAEIGAPVPNLPLAPPAQVRQVDLRRLTNLIERGHLSTREALYYRKLEDTAEFE